MQSPAASIHKDLFYSYLQLWITWFKAIKLFLEFQGLNESPKSNDKFAEMARYI